MRFHRLAAAALLAGCVSAIAQDTATQQTSPSTATPYVRRFSLGGRLSVPLLGQVTGGDRTENLTAGPTLIETTSENRSTWIGGGVTLQVAVSDRNAIAVDLLRRRQGFYLTTLTYTGTDNPNTTADERTIVGQKENTRASSWEMPVLFRRYNIGRFAEGRRWFWEAGGAIRRIGGIATFIEEDGEECCLQIPRAVSNRYTPGATVGAGLQLSDDYGVKIVPEVRYTHWLGRPFDAAAARSRKGQIEFLIGITF